jgi:hypothetical protein
MRTPPTGRRKCGSGGSTARDKRESGLGRVENKGGKTEKAARAAGRFRRCGHECEEEE